MPAVSASLVAAPPTVDVDSVKAHLQQLQTIASSNGGNRATGTAGHTATTTLPPPDRARSCGSR